MSKIAKIFTSEDNKTMWTYETATGEYHTVGIDVVEEGFSLVDGKPVPRVERNIVWVGHNNPEVLNRQAQIMVDMVNTGKLRAYKAYSETPFNAKSVMDINPQTNEPLGRYSEARMCTPEDYLKLHRQYVTVATANPVEEPATQQVVNAHP